MTDLTTDDDPKPPAQIYKCHAGKVVDLAPCPFDHYVASFGKDGRLYIYDYVQKKLVFDYEFPAKGCCMIWMPTEVEQMLNNDRADKTYNHVFLGYSFWRCCYSWIRRWSTESMLRKF